MGFPVSVLQPGISLKALSSPIVGLSSHFPSLRGHCLSVPEVRCPKLFHVLSNFSCSSGRADLVLDAPSWPGTEVPVILFN